MGRDVVNTSESGERVRALYRQGDAVRTASPTLARIDSESRSQFGLASPDGTITRAELRSLVTQLALSPGNRLLDLGCGTGAPAQQLTALSVASVIGVDLSQDRLRVAQGHPQQGHTSYVAADVNRALPLRSASFDAAIQLDSVIHVADKLALLSELKRVLRPRGRLAICSAAGEALDAAQQARMAEVPGTLFRVTADRLEHLLREAGFTVLVQQDRRAMLAAWHAHRLTVLEHAGPQLEAELGMAESEKLLGRTRALVELLETDVIDSVLLIAEN